MLLATIPLFFFIPECFLAFFSWVHPQSMSATISELFYSASSILRCCSLRLLSVSVEVKPTRTIVLFRQGKIKTPKALLIYNFAPQDSQFSYSESHHNLFLTGQIRRTATMINHKIPQFFMWITSLCCDKGCFFLLVCFIYIVTAGERQERQWRERERLGSNPGYCSKDSALYVLYQVSYQGGKPVLCWKILNYLDLKQDYKF